MNKFHRKFLAASIFFVEVFLFLLPINAISAPRPVAIFVNGDQNCCANNMSKTRQALSSLGMEVDYSAWNSITAHNMGSNPRNTQNFISSAFKYFDSLPRGTEVYLIGHSFGGDSILQLLGSYRRSHIKFRLVAILDAVGHSGRRDITKQNSVPSNVDYFFNRWQTNAPWPVDINTSGKIKCHANTCDQKEQSFSRGPDGNTRTKECTRVEACPGAEIRTGRNGLPFYYSGVKKTRLHHSFVPTDPYIEEQLINIATRLVATSNKPQFVKHGNNGTTSCDTFCSSPKYGFDVGTCSSAFNTKSGHDASCNSVPGDLGGPELTCNCSKNARVRPGNNGTINCNNFCGRTNEKCLSAFNQESEKTVSCNNTPGYLDGKHLLCSCI